MLFQTVKFIANGLTGVVRELLGEENDAKAVVSVGYGENEDVKEIHPVTSFEVLPTDLDDQIAECLRTLVDSRQTSRGWVGGGWTAGQKKQWLEGASALLRQWDGEPEVLKLGDRMREIPIQRPEKLDRRSVGTETTFFQRDAALACARRLENETGDPFYVVADLSSGSKMWAVETRMPVMPGLEWYTPDGVRHG